VLPNSDPNGDARDRTGTPRWVYVFVVNAIVLVVFVFLHLTGGRFSSHTL